MYKTQKKMHISFSLAMGQNRGFFFPPRKILVLASPEPSENAVSIQVVLNLFFPPWKWGKTSQLYFLLFPINQAWGTKYILVVEIAFSWFKKGKNPSYNKLRF